MTSDSEWSVDRWKQLEEEVRARQAPAGLTTASGDMLGRMPSLSLRMPANPTVSEQHSVSAAEWTAFSNIPAVRHSAITFDKLPLDLSFLSAQQPASNSSFPSNPSISTPVATVNQIPAFSGSNSFLNNLDDTFLKPLYSKLIGVSSIMPSYSHDFHAPQTPTASHKNSQFVSHALEGQSGLSKDMHTILNSSPGHFNAPYIINRTPAVVPATPSFVPRPKNLQPGSNSVEPNLKSPSPHSYNLATPSPAVFRTPNPPVHAPAPQVRSISSSSSSSRLDSTASAAVATVPVFDAAIQTPSRKDAVVVGMESAARISADVALRKCAESLQALLHADDSLTAGNANHVDTAAIVDLATGMPHSIALEAISRQLKKLIDLGESYRIFKVAELEDDEGWVKRLLKICERVLGSCERVVTFSNNSESSDGDKKMGDTKMSDVTIDLHEGFDVFFDASVLGMESAYLAMLVISICVGSNRKAYSEKTITTISSFLNSRASELNSAIRLYTDNDVESSVSNARDFRNLLDHSNAKKRLVSLMSKMGRCFEQLAKLFRQNSFQDGIVISAYTMCVSTFFVDVNSLSVYIGWDKLQMASMHVLTMIFAQAVPHRNAILEEVAGQLLKLQNAKKGLRQYKLSNGKAIQMISALFLQLLQSSFSGTSTADVLKEVQAFLVKRQLTGGVDDSIQANGRGINALNVFTAEDGSLVVNKFLSTAKQGLESVNSSAMFFMRYLVTRSFDSAGKGSAATAGSRKSLVASAETELRIVLDNLVEDMLVVLGEPEWPASEVVLVLLCKLMTQALDDKKSGDTAIKSFALDYLGHLSARLFGLADPQCLKLDNSHIQISHLKAVASEISSKPEAVSSDDGITVSKLLRLWEVESAVIDSMKAERENDLNYDSVCSFHTFSWIHSQSMILSKIPSLQSGALLSTCVGLCLEYCDIAGNFCIRDRFRYLSPSALTFPSTLEKHMLVKVASWCLFQKSHIQSIRETLLNYILASLDSESVTLRARSLKALSDVVAVDAKVLGMKSVKNVIGNRLLDSSKMVRDAAVELVGCYVTKEFEEGLITEYYPLLIQRILDVGAAVRKRIIRLAKDIAMFSISKETMTGVAMDAVSKDRTVEIACKLMGRVMDEETSIKELAYKSVAEILFSPFKQFVAVPGTRNDEGLSGSADNNARSRAFALQPISSKYEIKARVSLLIGVIDCLTSGGVNMPAAEGLGDILRHLADTNKKGDLTMVARSLVECVSENILGCEEVGDKESVKNALVLLNQIARVLPLLLIPHVRMLQTYLHSSSAGGNSDDDRRNEEKITAAAVSVLGFVIPHSVDPDLHLMAAIEGDLLALLARRSLTVVNLIVPCLTSIVHNVTKNYSKLTKVLITCLDNFEKSKVLIQRGALNANSIRAIARGLIIVSLLVRTFDFDKNRSVLMEKIGEDIARFPNVLSAVFASVSFFAGPSFPTDLRTVAFQALGNLFVANPRLMIHQTSQTLMNGVFKVDNIPHKVEVIKIFAEFLKAEQLRMLSEEQTKKASNPANNKEMDIKVLIGNADEMADAGVSSAVIQMYLNHILDGMMHVDMTLSTTSFDAVCIIIEQGLAHPLLCVPYVVAMQTSPVANIRDRAILVYDNLAEKHQTFIHSRTGECVRKAFDYRLNLMLSQKQQDDHQLHWVQGHLVEITESDEGPRESTVAMLSNMYGKLQVKRQRRNDFLMTLVRSFDLDADGVKDDKAILFGRFLAENLAALSFKSTDEVNIVIYHICQLLSVSGETVLKFINEWRGSTQTDEKALFSVSKTSVLLGMLVLLKTYLQKTFSLSESKCRSYTPAEGSRNTEKSRPAIRKSRDTLDWNRWPFACNRLLTTAQDMAAQLLLFEELMNSDYYISTSDDDGMDFEDLSAAAAEIPGPVLEVGVDVEAVVLVDALTAQPKSKRRSSLTGNGTAPKKARRMSAKSSGARASASSASATDRPKRKESRVSMAESSDNDE
ncbi:Sister chromatid cohesion protein 2 [Chytriomyces hyalinus]|nr:Sister chromatid cohesion protein 2 [Chytriomyces hyalinus]